MQGVITSSGDEGVGTGATREGVIAITAGEGRMLTPTPFDMGLIIMGDNSVAFDAVCSAIVGLGARTLATSK